MFEILDIYTWHQIVSKAEVTETHIGITLAVPNLGIH